jgi:hypothetical protein
LASVSLAAVLSSRVVPQEDSAGAAEPPEEVTIRGQKTMTQYRLELERARDDVFRLFNEANRGTGTDITCRDEQATGRRIRQSVCRSNAENRSDAVAARGFLSGLLMSAGKGEGGTQAAANIATGAAQGGGESGEADALAKFELEWRRLLAENRDLYDAVVKYAELDDEYARARGAAVAPLPDLVRGAPPESPAAVCEASTLTEYSQRNNVALVSGTVSLSGCPAGTTGGFTVVARVRNDAGETNAIEFDETWQRVDAQDHKFESEYPIGENVFLSSVRVRNLTCSCANAPQ